MQLNYQLFYKEDDLDFEPHEEDEGNETTKEAEEISDSLEDVTTAKGIFFSFFKKIKS